MTPRTFWRFTFCLQDLFSQVSSNRFDILFLFTNYSNEEKFSKSRKCLERLKVSNASFFIQNSLFLSFILSLNSIFILHFFIPNPGQLKRLEVLPWNELVLAVQEKLVHPDQIRPQRLQKTIEEAFESFQNPKCPISVTKFKGSFSVSKLVHVKSAMRNYTGAVMSQYLH